MRSHPLRATGTGWPKADSARFGKEAGRVGFVFCFSSFLPANGKVWSFRIIGKTNPEANSLELSEIPDVGVFLLLFDRIVICKTNIFWFSRLGLDGVREVAFQVVPTGLEFHYM